jgi:hypothetical protein
MSEISVQGSKSRLDLAGDEMADVGLFVEIALHEEVLLAGGRIDLRYLFDAASIVGHVIGLAELAFHHDEDGLHDPLLSRGPLLRGSGMRPSQVFVFNRPG